MAVALFVATLLAAGGVVAPARSAPLDRIGHDFLPFYAAGSLVREGRGNQIYDVDTLRQREREIAESNHLALGAGFGPFWNPPFYALPFAPLSALPFRSAMLTWLAINLAALAAAMVMLCRIVAQPGDWRTWGLVPLLILASTPFFLALTHGQNTFGSLLLLTLATLAWRARRGLLVGLVVGLMAYKPQLAALVGLIALIDLGWRVAAGAALAGGTLLLTAALALPGILETYRASLPNLLHFMQVEQVYMWERHVTLKAFWRLLIQGYAPGESHAVVTLLTTTSAGVLGVSLLMAAFKWRGRLARVGNAKDAAEPRDPAPARDRLIAATIASMPLLMPFYFDYDLLLLAVPAVLLARHWSGGRVLLAGWCALYVWLVINPDVAEQTRVNFAVPLLAVIAGGLVVRALRRDAETTQCTAVEQPPAPFAAAA